MIGVFATNFDCFVGAVTVDYDNLIHDVLDAIETPSDSRLGVSCQYHSRDIRQASSTPASEAPVTAEKTESRVIFLSCTIAHLLWKNL